MEPLKTIHQIEAQKYENTKSTKFTKKLYFRCYFIARVLSDIIFIQHLYLCIWYHDSLTYYCKQSLKY